jgi:pimeloyl-ACP methyl ester carboxylesterase
VRHDLQMFFRNAKPSHTLRAAEQLRETNVPALVVWTKLPSPVFPKAHGRRLAKLIPNARYEEVGGALAFMPEDKPERLAELIGEFATGG